MYFKLEYKGEILTIHPWTTRDEMAFLLYINEDSTIHDVFDAMVKIEGTHNFNEVDKEYLVYQTYMNSTGGQPSIRFKCDCEQLNEVDVDMQEMIQFDTEAKHFNTSLGEITVQSGEVSVNDDILDELDLKLYKEIERAKEAQTITLKGNVQCMMCHKENLVRLPENFWRAGIVNNSLNYYYELGHNFTYKGKLQLQDFYEMLPFERDIYFSIIEDTIKKINESRQ